MGGRFVIDAANDDSGFEAARDELVEGFAVWAGSSLPGDPSDASVALDWKAFYADGDLVTWRTADVAEFALEWCPRKLSIPPEQGPAFLATVGRFFVFLAARGLLGTGSDGPERLRSWCERHESRFVTEMSDPANFGMAKGLFAGVGGLERIPDGPDDVEALMERVRELDPDRFDAIVGNSLDPAPVELPPVVRPDPDDVEAAASAMPVAARVAALRGACTGSGLALTQKGNLRLADARHLVSALGTGDAHATQARSAEEIPELDHVLRVALRARAVRRQKGRLLAVGTWEKVGQLEQANRLADAAAVEGLVYPSWSPPAPEVGANLDELTMQVLIVLLAAGSGGSDVEIDEVVASLLDGQVEPGSWRFGHGAGLIRRCLDRLEDLGMIIQEGVTAGTGVLEAETRTGGRFRPTAFGVAVACRWLEEVGFRVPELPDAATATAAELLGLVGTIGPEPWSTMLGEWMDAHDDAAEQLTAGLRDPGWAPDVVLSTLATFAESSVDEGEQIVTGLLGGRWDGVAAMWLADRGHPEHLEDDPRRGLAGMIDLLTVTLDGEGPDAMVEQLPPVSVGAVLDDMWRVEHPRVGDVLEVVGRHHPDKGTAKSARRSLAKWRSDAGSGRPGGRRGGRGTRW